MIEENKQIKQENVNLSDQQADLKLIIEDLRITKSEKEAENAMLEVQKRNILQSISDLEQQAKQSAKIFETQTMEIAQKNIEQSMERLGAEYQQTEDKYRQDYQLMVEECVANLRTVLAEKDKEIAEKDESINKINAVLNDLQAKSDSAVAAAKRAEEMRTAANFYKLQLSSVDLQEIEMLRNIAPYLRDKEPLNKIIWKVYYEKPYTDLIGRVVGTGIKTGIYKITNTQNEMCYVGQAVNISDRWKQHIKRGIGAEAPTRNKLYPAMLEIGVENFTFEIIEECDRAMLNEREDYWQEYFHAKDFGYSIK